VAAEASIYLARQGLSLFSTMNSKVIMTDVNVESKVECGKGEMGQWLRTGHLEPRVTDSIPSPLYY